MTSREEAIRTLTEHRDALSVAIDALTEVEKTGAKVIEMPARCGVPVELAPSLRPMLTRR